MRFATIQTASGRRSAVVRLNYYVDLHATDSSLPSSLRELLEGGPAALKAAERAAEQKNAVTHDAGRVKLLPPIPDPKKIVCVGLNYRDHAAESGAPIPKDPVLFSKYATALIGHEQTIVLPKVSQEVDFEAEFVIVIGKKGRHIAKA